MKAWRNKQAQDTFRAEHNIPAHIRVGKVLRDQQVRIIAGPSFLMQALLINAGLMQAG
jgi:hypothetical protein